MQVRKVRAEKRVGEDILDSSLSRLRAALNSISRVQCMRAVIQLVHAQRLLPRVCMRCSVLSPRTLVTGKACGRYSESICTFRSQTMRA